MADKGKFRTIQGWADVGSHGSIFEFVAGPVHALYGPLLHVWARKVSNHLLPVEIRIPLTAREIGPRRKGGKK